ncbi:MAG: GTP 3',8-cyclase MoaA [Deltaproteobacteria bacterium]|nr:GTP 3',8-cyclase MoaA [Deltaproteobacteria bacterium]MBW1928140.1 GTP 3',8-cyclase MoaA [Deltaproteobacteria bacterium]MBW2025665.1 GTP 3',8-cyclase MoaA [Deltaproteobacteria bacterium]MBW2125639.1 GTP 3',8-cyclase MoaA [Deltaproteobacteria bacterium]RLB18108.1 MAG: GTP 3',8-cyclase MoaA [Deltaproteobacteria bacterium]
MDKKTMSLIDSYHRRINYLRISVTDRCNLRCLYCMPRGEITKLMHEEILRYEEILRLARVAVSLGITKIRVTGGEPLIRKGIMHFLESLASVEGLEDIGLTTNGVLLKEKLQHIWDAGIRRINISLDTLDRARYRDITGFDKFDHVWEAIEAARDMGFNPIKINVVVMSNINEDELEAFAALSLNNPYHVRFIEYMPIGSSPSHFTPGFIASEDIKQRLERMGVLEPVKKSPHDGPAERYRFKGATGEIGFISAMTNHFCKTCNRLRLTAAGHLRPCLLSSREIDIKTPLRKGATDQELASLFMKATLMKPYSHGIVREQSELFPGEMSSIGG